MPQDRLRAGILSLLVLALVASACSSSGGGSTASDSTPSPAGQTSPGAGEPASPPGSGPTIAAVGDLVCAFGTRIPPIQEQNDHEPVCDPRPVAKQIHAGDYRAFLPLGDLQYSYGGYWRYVKYWDRYYGDIVGITKPVAGNHEGYADFTGYVKYFGPAKTHMPARIGRVHIGERVGRVKGYYSYDIGSWHLIALNSQLCMNKMWNLRTGWTAPIRGGGCGPGDPQTKWLERDLAEHPDGCSLAYFHHPRFAMGDKEEISNEGHMPLFATLAEGGVDLALASHEHNYQRWGPVNGQGAADPNGLTQFIVGTGGNSYRPIAPEDEWPDTLVAADDGSYGVLELQLDEGSVTYDFAPAPGEAPFEDSGTITCH